jgi:hypothetical protein
MHYLFMYMLIQEPNGQLYSVNTGMQLQKSRQEHIHDRRENNNKLRLKLIIVIIILQIMSLSCPEVGNSRRLCLSRKLHDVMYPTPITIMTQLVPLAWPTLLNSASVWSVEAVTQQRWWRQQGRFLNRETRSCVGIAQLIRLPRLEVRQYAFKHGGYNALEWEKGNSSSDFASFCYSEKLMPLPNRRIRKECSSYGPFHLLVLIVTFILCFGDY